MKTKETILCIYENGRFYCTENCDTKTCSEYKPVSKTNNGCKYLNTELLCWNVYCHGEVTKQILNKINNGQKIEEILNSQKECCNLEEVLNKIKEGQYIMPVKKLAPKRKEEKEEKKILKILKVGETNDIIIFKIDYQNFEKMEDFTYKNVTIRLLNYPQLYEDINKISLFLKGSNIKFNNYLLTCKKHNYKLIEEAVEAFNASDNDFKGSLKKVSDNLSELNIDNKKRSDDFLYDIRRVLTLEDFHKLKFAYMFNIVQSLPLNASFCVDCVQNNFDCTVCEFKNLHGNCYDSGSDFQKIVSAKVQLLSALKKLT